MNIVLTSVDTELADAWQRFCGDIDFVTIHRGSIFDVTCDAVVSPANSFGFMDGGIDLLYSMAFGWGVQERLQRLIRERHHGELIVGAADIVPTDNVDIPYVIAAPTMRVPMVLEETVNPYLAARAALLLVKHGVFAVGEHAGQPVASVVKTIAFPGLGTGVGRVGPNICAHQMRQAIEEVVLDKGTYPKSWHDASTRHRRMFIGFED